MTIQTQNGVVWKESKYQERMATGVPWQKILIKLPVRNQMGKSKSKKIRKTRQCISGALKKAFLKETQLNYLWEYCLPNHHVGYYCLPNHHEGYFFFVHSLTVKDIIDLDISIQLVLGVTNHDSYSGVEPTLNMKLKRNTG